MRSQCAFFVAEIPRLGYNRSMIRGIGNDIVDIGRIEKMVEAHGQRFFDRCFTAAEMARAQVKRDAGNHAGFVATLAKRYAAKEACSKALGTGIGEAAGLTEIEVLNDDSGRPYINLSGAAAATAAGLMPAEHMPVVHLSLSDEPPLAQAFVILEAIPAQ